MSNRRKMTSRRPFNYAEFVAGWRAIAADHGIDPVTGCYNYADDPGWWKRPVHVDRRRNFA